MASLKEVRIRITSVNSTRQITSAMKMVSASKLRKAQNAILNMRPYAQKLHTIMQDITHDLDGSDEGVYAANRGDNQILIITITSNRGLCGAFNSNIVKRAVNLIESKYANQYKKGNVSLMCIGKKGADGLISAGYKPVDIITDVFEHLSFENTVPIAEELMQMFSDSSYDKIILIYNQFKNAAVQLLQEEQLLPIIESGENETSEKEELKANYIFEPSKEEIMEVLVPKAIKVQLYKALLDSFASEHGARMTAMHQATENANELIKELKLKYNKARQASITNEILEIVGGAEALSS
ncbi:MAG: ATP synthase F1 subunit gamma [Bacteroidetes bacterium]|nr:ATP synthase F1 subunit gamma [Bacteroidota bacterium]MBL6942795.1 ATP synthase F1 subunit gamma [Bacteroidales bacterium]